MEEIAYWFGKNGLDYTLADALVMRRPLSNEEDRYIRGVTIRGWKRSR